MAEPPLPQLKPELIPAPLVKEDLISVTEVVHSEAIAPPSAEELVAKAIAPVKREFLCPPPPRPSSAAGKTNEEASITEKSNSSKLVKEKKSKRQLKRERQEERKSSLNLCSEVAKSGDANSCKYGVKCRLSHDLEMYKAQKPADLEGTCPFIVSGNLCPYGITCRFLGTHPDENTAAQRQDSEVNGLKKDVQRLLWKNNMKFKKSDAALKLLGIGSKGYQKAHDKDDEQVENQPIANVSSVELGNGHSSDNKSVNKDQAGEEGHEEDSVDGTTTTDDTRPTKKSKSMNDDKCCTHGKVDDVVVVKESTEKCLATEEQVTEDTIVPETDASLKNHAREKKLIDFSRKLYLAPLTTVGNLPFRRLCKALGADVTCGEMAMCTNLLQGQASEWALLRRHSSEDLFGVQICGAYPDTVSRAVELIEQECSVDFIDINMGCPIDIVVNKGAGSALLTKPQRMQNVIQSACATAETPITVKVRTGYLEGRNRVESFIADIAKWGASAVTIHGRSRQQRYSKLADWEYIYQCVKKAPANLQVIGNGDVFSYSDWNKHLSDCPELSSSMIARGSLIKPWLFTEIKEQRHWDISSSERLDILKDYVRFGLEHWGSDSKGVETTRHFLLEWLSYMFRYVPVGLLEVIPQKLNWRPPSYFGRNDLETLMASDSAADWIRISEMLLGKVPDGFTFAPKHKSNAYDSAENVQVYFNENNGPKTSITGKKMCLLIKTVCSFVESMAYLHGLKVANPLTII
ncbi:hypothetical protein V2J09_006986 [Rumex salicifolius]